MDDLLADRFGDE